MRNSLTLKSMWEVVSIKGKDVYTVNEKLKSKQNKWNKEVFGFVDLRIEKVVAKIDELVDQKN